MKRTIVITGGAGFIGANFVYYELEKHPEDRIICLDKLTYAGNLETLEDAMKNDNFRFVKGDIADKECVEKLFEEDTCSHSAVSSSASLIHNPGYTKPSASGLLWGYPRFTFPGGKVMLSHRLLLALW